MRYVIKFTAFLFRELEKGTITLPGFYPEWSEPTFKVVRFLLISLHGGCRISLHARSQSPAFKGVSIFLGVLFSLGSTSAVANVVAGVSSPTPAPSPSETASRSMKTLATWWEKNLLATHIRTIKNVEITIPNSLVLGSHILNYSASSRDNGLILHTCVTIGYDVPWRKVHEILITAALRTGHILPEPPPFILQTALNDFYVSYELNAHTDAPHLMAGTYSDLHQNIQDCFNEAGVEIMSPHYAQLRDGSQTTIPEQYLPEGYTPGGIRITSTKD